RLGRLRACPRGEKTGSSERRRGCPDHDPTHGHPRCEKNLTPHPPSLRGKGEPDSPPRLGEGPGEGFLPSRRWLIRKLNLQIVPDDVNGVTPGPNPRVLGPRAVAETKPPVVPRAGDDPI